MIERWRVAIHESAHSVVALALGGTCKSLSLHPEGRGIAVIDGLSSFDFAVATAAASAAEEALANELVPEPEPFHTRRKIPDCGSVPTADLAAISARFPLRTAASDEQTIARFCISGLEGEPERWAARYYLVREIARRVVEDRQQRILAVATALYSRGILREDEIKEEARKHERNHDRQ
jgi:hypothetical protein